jgi:hypothetical protein
MQQVIGRYELSEADEPDVEVRAGWRNQLVSILRCWRNAVMYGVTYSQPHDEAKCRAYSEISLLASGWLQRARDGKNPPDSHLYTSIMM